MNNYELYARLQIAVDEAITDLEQLKAGLKDFSTLIKCGTKPTITLSNIVKYATLLADDAKDIRTLVYNNYSEACDDGREVL